MDRAIEQYRLLVHQVNRGQLEIPNRNLDTGNQTRLGEYGDRTYGALLKRLAKGRFRDLTPGVRTDMLALEGCSVRQHDEILLTCRKVSYNRAPRNLRRPGL